MLFAKTAFAVFAASVTSVVASGNQVALYWGQNGAGGEERLSYYCQDAGVDIVLLAFLDGNSGSPNLSFRNQCGDQYPSGLLHCSQIGEDIKTCQASGTKVLLSVRGDVLAPDSASATDILDFADVLWNKFGAGTEDSERPFDDAVVDGFDFSGELGSDVGYPELAQALRSKFRRQSAKSYYLSASPQCPYPDSKVGALMAQEQLDYAFIQFYNNYCSANGDFNYDTWAEYAAGAPNPNIELFVGLPSTGNIDGYVDADKVGEIVQEISCNPNFAGISLWDASGAWLNVNNEGQNFVAQVKDQLNQHSCSATTTSTVNETSESANETSEVPPVDETSESANETSEVPPVDETSENDTQTTTDATTANTTTTNAAANETSDEPESQATVTATTDAVDETSEDSETQVTTVAPGQSSIFKSVCVPVSSVYSNSESHDALSLTSLAPGAVNGASGASGTITAVGTTVITITSCSNNVCTHVPVTTGVVTVTQLDTTYTTFCPLTSEVSTLTAEAADQSQMSTIVKTTVVTINTCDSSSSTVDSAAASSPSSSAPAPGGESSDSEVNASSLVSFVPVAQQSNEAGYGVEVEAIPDGASVLVSGVAASLIAALIAMVLV
ncbi:uncharacterized protein LODBEIA_P55370 [Lodderomyces beijingensis]|uniref:GH18 domain-containing protein n=1 Tax=Lodderomyces beijingensis TaxID=1775926 RepID=A0ABP0ZUI3_9ASCO